MNCIVFFFQKLFHFHSLDFLKDFLSGRPRDVFTRVSLPALFIILNLFTGCNSNRIPHEVRQSLKIAGKNKQELMKVIDHYQKVEKDRNKIEAAYYLIRNMSGHYYYDGQDVFDEVFKEMENMKKMNVHKMRIGDIIRPTIDSIRAASVFNLQYDILTLNAEYIIENIDLAFEAYYMVPHKLRYNSSVFHKYVLPYRNSTEVPEPALRKYFFAKYFWVFERMEKYGSVELAVCDLLDSLDIDHLGYNYPYAMPVSKIYTIRLGSCSNLVNFGVFILRALGIPAANDFTPKWGSNYSTGHDWIVLFPEDTLCAFDIVDRKVMNFLYRDEALPKIYRREFESNKGIYEKAKDVTKNYRDTKNIEFKHENSKHACLAVFCRKSDYIIVDLVKGKRGRYIFKDVGRDVVYALIPLQATIHKEINSWVYVTRAGEKQQLNADYVNRVNAIITRKNPLFVPRRADRMLWAKSLNGLKIQASNKDDFSDAVTLTEIKNFGSSNKINITTDNTKEYKNYRLVSSDTAEIHLAGFNLMKNDKVIHTRWDVLHPQTEMPVVDGHAYKVIDEKPLTYISAKYLRVNYYFDKPVCVSEFQIQARNDDNNVKQGCRYELMYWDKGWNSAGEKVANDTLLIYENLPSGTLYWLKNHTEGRDEQVFLINTDGNQFWPGSTAFIQSYSNYLRLSEICEINLKEPSL